MDIEVPDAWGDDCTAGQIKKQALDSAQAAIRNGLILDDFVRSGTDPKTHAKLVGEPRIIQISRVSERSR